MDLNLTGKTIARLRKAAGLTQASLAEKLGVSDKAVSKWERGIACPDVALWNKLSILLDTDIESLIYGHEGKNEWRGYLILDGAIPADTIIYNKPMINYLISQFLLVGIRDIVICGKCDDINLPGIEIIVVADEEELNRQFTKPAFVIYGSSFIYGPNLTKHFKRAMSRIDGLTVISSMKRKGQYPLVVDENRKACIADRIELNQYFAEPFVFVPKSSSSNRIYSFEEILHNKNLNAETMVRGMCSFRVNSFEDLFQMAEFVRMIENHTNEKVACVEEILIRRGIASFDEISDICDSETKRYLGELY